MTSLKVIVITKIKCTSKFTTLDFFPLMQHQNLITVPGEQNSLIIHRLTTHNIRESSHGCQHDVTNSASYSCQRPVSNTSRCSKVLHGQRKNKFLTSQILWVWHSHTKLKAAHSYADKDQCLQNMYFQLEDVEDVKILLKLLTLLQIQLQFCWS
jgi:hypothetical protein